MNTLTFDGHNSQEFGIAISGEGSFDAPARDVTAVSIPGRNGDLILDNGRYKNITVSYPAILYRSFSANVAAARAWLLGPTGYAELTDDYNPGYFRRAIYTGGIDWDMWPRNREGEVTLKFNCKPQRFLVSGSDTITAENGGSITNPTIFRALPLITVYGTGDGDLTIGDTTVTLTDLDSEIYLDCDLQDAYIGLDSANSKMAGEFPTLAPGANAVAWTGDITGVDIVPRWWTI